MLSTISTTSAPVKAPSVAGNTEKALAVRVDEFPKGEMFASAEAPVPPPPLKLRAGFAV